MSTHKAGQRLRGRLFSYTGSSLSERTRERRWELLTRRFPDLGDMRVIDLGGTTWDWTLGLSRALEKLQLKAATPKEVLVVNLDEGALTNPADWIQTLTGDACALPAEILGTNFDLVFSNSLIEHVGGHWRRVAMTENVHHLADHHWVQTPYRYFPVEPHWMFPFFQFLPIAARARISRHWPLTPDDLRGDSKDGALDAALGVELLSKVELRRLFPSSELIHERFVGLTKSLIVTR
jgi:hypothetical protein